MIWSGHNDNRHPFLYRSEVAWFRNNGPNAAWDKYIIRAQSDNQCHLGIDGEWQKHRVAEFEGTDIGGGGGFCSGLLRSAVMV